MYEECAAGFGLQSVLSVCSIQAALEVLSHSSAARGFTSRQGMGRAQHIQTRFLWVQERVREGHFTGSTKREKEQSRRSLYESSQWSVTREVSQEPGPQARCSVDEYKKVLVS